MFETPHDLAAALQHLPLPDLDAMTVARARQAELTKPAGSLGRLEDVAAFLAAWSLTGGRPCVDHVQLHVFAGNHGVTAQGVSPFPADVTQQMVANFTAGGAAINQLTDAFGIDLHITPLHLERPTADVTSGPAMDEAETLEALNSGAAALDGVRPDVLALGEMGIGNTSVAALLCGLAIGGTAADWVGPGTGLDAEGVARKTTIIGTALAHHRRALASAGGGEANKPNAFELLRRAGGRETAAIAGAIVAARKARVPVLIDGYVVTAALAALWAEAPDITQHCVAAHRSAEPAHGRSLKVLGLDPLLDLDMRLGEGTGAALAVPVLRAAAATHNGMATFAEASVSGRSQI